MKRILAIKDSRLEALELKVQQHVSLSFPLFKNVNKYLRIDVKIKFKKQLTGRESYPIRTCPHKRKVFANEIE